jgi:hypothetical protein
VFKEIPRRERRKIEHRPPNFLEKAMINAVYAKQGKPKPFPEEDIENGEVKGREFDQGDGI